MAERQQPKRKPLGKSLSRTDAELDTLSAIAGADIEAARARVRDALPPVLRTEDDAGRPYALRDPAALWDAGQEGE